MFPSKLIQLNGLDMAINNAIQSSFMKYKDFHSDPHFWATTKLKSCVENGVSNWSIQNRASNLSNNSAVGGPPSNGFRITFGLNILLSYRVRFKTNADFGYGFRGENFAGSGSAHLSMYNSGLGVGVDKSNLVFDVTAAVVLTAGGGYGTPLQSYSLNYNSRIPMLNNFNYSLSYGQALTWNSALNQKRFSLDRIQREGLVGFRVFDVNVSSNNDTRRVYFGGGTDMGWTGGISLVTPFMEVGFQDFSGYNEATGAYSEREKINTQMKEVKNDILLSKDERDDKLRDLDQKLRNILQASPFHKQEAYQKNLNKASTYIRLNRNGYQATVDVIGSAWLQNMIHKKIHDFRFEYNHKQIQTWAGRNW